MTLYVCAVALDADAEGPDGTPIYILDVLPKYSGRGQIGQEFWDRYKAVFEYSRIWICHSSEMPYRKLVNIKFHKGETV